MNDPVTSSVNCDKLIKMALAEDITGEDASTNAVIRGYVRGNVQLICKQKGIICGLNVFARTFLLLDDKTQITFNVKDGDMVEPGQLLGEISGDIRVLLSGERTA